MPHRTGKDKMKDSKTEIRTDRKPKHETLTGVCLILHTKSKQ